MAVAKAADVERKSNTALTTSRLLDIKAGFPGGSLLVREDVRRISSFNVHEESHVRCSGKIPSDRESNELSIDIKESHRTNSGESAGDDPMTQ